MIKFNIFLDKLMFRDAEEGRRTLRILTLLDRSFESKPSDCLTFLYLQYVLEVLNKRPSIQ